MIDRVVSMLREVGDELVLPRFRNLVDGDVLEKSPGGIVTVVDRQVESELEVRLSALLHGSLVVGEEAVAADHRVLERIGDPGPVWVVDPIDGTGNFAAGREPFAIMVALLRGGDPVLAAIYEPVPGTVTAAELGGGSYMDGVRVVMDRTPVTTPSDLRGTLSVTYLPESLREQVLARSGRLGQVMPPQFCAGREYPNLIRGEQHFSLFWRSLPWDHAPGVLITREAGGVVRHFDGTDYDPAQPRLGLLACRDEEVFDLARQALLE
jgi:fructose-1,6-bisphosphatase/inositol monophosphatase family enzyme